MNDCHTSIWAKKVLVFGVFVTSISWGLTVAKDIVPRDINAEIKQSPLSLQDMSLYVAPVDSGEPIINWLSQTPRKPASVAKVITTGMGLLLLGDDYRWKTEFYTHGAVENGTLKGDLFIKGYGNPYLVEENMQSMVTELRALGIENIAGRVVLDGSYFIRRAENPDAFDGHGMEPYNAIPSALNINFRTIELVMSASGSGVNIKTFPKLSYLHIDNQMHTNNLRCRGKGYNPKLSINRQTQVLTVTGSLSKQCGQKRLTRVIADSGDLFFAHFQRFWLQSGGKLTGRWLYGQRDEKAKLLYVAYSQTLDAQIEAMNKHSNNVMTRQLFLTIGAELTQPPATKNKARAVVVDQLKKMGINTSGFFIDNGSGLSRRTKMTARQLAQYLIAMQGDIRISNYFKTSLSIAGVDGTLRKRLRNTPLVDNVMGKTGTLDNVKSLAGYLTAQSGRKFVFVLMFEGRNAKSGRKLMDNILLWTYYNN